MSVEVVIGLAALAMVGWAALGAHQKKRRRAALMARYGDVAVVDLIMEKRIVQGMTSDQLIESWGMPVERDHSNLKTKTREIFKYNQTGKNRFANRVVVENGVVVGWKSAGER